MQTIHLLHLLFIYVVLQMADIYVPLLVGATVYFAQPDALKVSLSVHSYCPHFLLS